MTNITRKNTPHMFDNKLNCNLSDWDVSGIKRVVDNSDKNSEVSYTNYSNSFVDNSTSDNFENNFFMFLTFFILFQSLCYVALC